MKNWFFLGVLLLVGCVSNEKREARAVKSVLDSAALHVMESKRSIGDPAYIEGQLLRDALHKIDFADCPKTFRLAWVDYLHSLDRFWALDKRPEMSSDGALSGLMVWAMSGGSGFPMLAVKGGFTDRVKYEAAVAQWEASARQNVEACQESWRAVERAAIEAGAVVTVR